MLGCRDWASCELLRDVIETIDIQLSNGRLEVPVTFEFCVRSEQSDATR